MKYKLGDFVRFVDEKMEGFVTRIINEQMIGVTGDDDFEIPVLASKVTSVHGYGAAADNGSNAKDLHVPAAEFKTKGVYLGLTNDARANSVMHFYLINDTSFQLTATLTTEGQSKYKGEYIGIIAPVSAVKVYSAQLADMQLWPKLLFNISFFTTQNVALPVALSITEKLKAKDLAGAKKKLPQLNENGWLIQLDEPDFVIDPERIKESFFKPAEEKKEIERPKHEVDLHIEKLRDDHQFINSVEILNIQLTHFNKTLDAAIVHQLPEITFIHGAGNGTLRHELHKLLSKNNRIKTFMDARKEKFGYGATKVIIK